MAILTPEAEAKNGKLGEAHWFDVKRLDVQSKKPVMAVPTFEVVPGPAHKPPYPSQPR